MFIWSLLKKKSLNTNQLVNKALRALSYRFKYLLWQVYHFSITLYFSPILKISFTPKLHQITEYSNLRDKNRYKLQNLTNTHIKTMLSPTRWMYIWALIICTASSLPLFIAITPFKLELTTLVVIVNLAILLACSYSLHQLRKNNWKNENNNTNIFKALKKLFQILCLYRFNVDEKKSKHKNNYYKNFYHSPGWRNTPLFF